MRNGSETNPDSLRFALKRKKIEVKLAHPTSESKTRHRICGG
jgi:hypothetical protein